MTRRPPDLTAELARLTDAHRRRRRRIRVTPQQPTTVSEGRALLSFCSNDYLGLANHPRIVAAFQAGAAAWGVGAGAAHLVNGHTAAHHALEEELAACVGLPRALLFSTGYQANLGAIAALTGRADRIFADRLNHASLLDGALLARARLRRYPHGDTAALARLLDRTEDADGTTLIATDGVFSMDGDLAPLPELTRLAAASGAWLLIDDAHGLGVLGRAGRGTLDELGVAPDPDRHLLIGTLGKALGTFGAFAAGSEALIETLIQRARPYVYTTASPPALAEATRAALAIASREDWRRERLRALIARFRHGARQLGLPLAESPTPIQPLIAGTDRRALAWSAALEARGLLVTAIRPPTVPEGAARLRIALSAAHTEDQVDQLLDALAELPADAPEHG